MKTILLPFAISTITAALIFYTLGVFSEKRAKNLKISHVLFFGLGLLFDTTGTALMSRIAAMTTTVPAGMGLHQITGALAMLLMAGHFVWALVTYFKGSQKAKENFHRFSMVVWLFWLIPYGAGIFMGMGH